ncbi:MAG TPA: SH3 domain-containing protein, partial [Candidatus Polarisedimenticolia bacterium]|nr:SH3 domain-containing protein [Candidatus Polarisedimenticolia bacterium]
KILDYGLRDPRVDYNLGNAYFRMGRLGAAILHFERALRVDPTDVEARDNLDLARGRIRDRAEAPEAPYPVKVLRDLVEAPAFAFLEGLFLALYVAAGGLVGALLLSRGEARRRLLGYGALCLGLGMLLSGGALVFRIREATANQAIVMQDKVDVRAGPAEDNTVLFTVHEGTRVEVRSRVDGWYQVSLPSALSGWLPVASVERV